MTLPYRSVATREPSQEELRKIAIARAWAALRWRVRVQVALFIGFIPFAVAVLYAVGGTRFSDIAWYVFAYAIVYSIASFVVWSSRCPVCESRFTIQPFFSSRCRRCGARPGNEGDVR